MTNKQIVICIREFKSTAKFIWFCHLAATNSTTFIFCPSFAHLYRPHARVVVVQSLDRRKAKSPSRAKQQVCLFFSLYQHTKFTLALFSS